MGEKQGRPKPEFIKVGPLEFHPVVFPTSALLIAAFTLWGFLSAKADAKGTEATFSNLLEWIATHFGWFYILTANLLLICVGVLIFSRLGRIRLGGPGCRPDYSFGTWFAMLFSAGMGIGLMFWSVAEPIHHFDSPPEILASGSPEAARESMLITFYHWGLHAWGIYALVGCAIAYFSFNHGLPMTIRSTFFPLLGERVRGPFGHFIDILAVVATLFGVATSLGLGVLQVNSGLHYLFPGQVPANGTHNGTAMQMFLIMAITLAATASVVSGLDRGIKRLSQGNLILACALLLLVFVLGPTAHLLDVFLQNLGNYVYRLIPISTWTETYREGSGGNWQHSWTIFYWGWWISWSPFVGMFIARISRGRTIREFALGVLIVPTVLTFVWLTVFGNAALYEEMANGGGIVEAVNQDLSTAIFKLFEHYPLSQITNGIAIMVVITFFVTSSDSGSLVIDTITGGGHPKPPVVQKVFWALLEGAVAAALLYAGGLKALQSASITTGLPFALALLVMAACLFKALRNDPGTTAGKSEDPKTTLPEN